MQKRGLWFRSANLSGVAQLTLDILVPPVKNQPQIHGGVIDDADILVLQRLFISGTAAVAGSVKIQSVEDPSGTPTIRVLHEVVFTVGTPVNFAMDFGEGRPLPARPPSSTVNKTAKLMVAAFTAAGATQNFSAMFLSNRAHLSVDGFYCPIGSIRWDNESLTTG